MRWRGWSLRSSLWFVLLAALGLGAAARTWSNWKRGGVEYHRSLAAQFDRLAARDQRGAVLHEVESSEKILFDPAAAADDLGWAIWLDADAQANSLLAASLAAKAEACERSRVGWVFVLCDTAWHSPKPPVRHSSGGGRGRPWVERDTLPYYLLVTLAHVDYPGLAVLALAFALRWSFTPARGVAGDPDVRVASPPGVE